VVAALHEIGADLGDPVEVTRSGGQVRVSGMGIAQSRQNEIERAVEGIPHVAIEFAAPPPAPDAPAAAAAAADGTKTGAMQSRLEQQLGGRAEFARFSAQILDWNDAAMARCYALRALAQRFTPDIGRAMSAADREILTGMAREHLAAMAGNVDSIQRTLAPVLVSLGGLTAQGRPVTSRSTWQEATENLFRSARRVELLLASALGVTQDGTASDRLPSDLMTALSELRTNLEQSDRLLP
jgi:hypothetical protein